MIEKAKAVTNMAKKRWSHLSLAGYKYELFGMSFDRQERESQQRKCGRETESKE